MTKMDQLIEQAKWMIKHMDPATKNALRDAVQQTDRSGSDNSNLVKRVLQKLDPATRSQLEHQIKKGAHMP